MRQQWQYDVVTAKKKELKDRLNKYGKEGWEGFSAVPEPGMSNQYMIVFLKRPIWPLPPSGGSGV